MISHSFAFSASACTAFPSTLVGMLELSPPLPVLLLRVGGLSLLNTRAVKWPEREADLYSTEVKDGGVIPPLTHSCSWLSA
jgi:hypothetical protein